MRDSMLDHTSGCRNDHRRLELMFGAAPGFMALLEGPQHTIAVANQAFVDLVGKRALISKALAEALPEFVEQGIDEILDGVAYSGEPFVAHGLSLRVTRQDGPMQEVLVDLVFQPVPASDDEPSGIFIQGQNVTEDRTNAALREAHNKVLELAIGDAPLETTLTELIRIVEMTSRTGVLGSILLLDVDGKHLRHGAAPSLPPEYDAAIDGAAIGPCAGSCGTAAYLGAAVFVSDIATDPLWADYKSIALPHGLRACWSTPIFDEAGKLIGTFAIYYRTPRAPHPEEVQAINELSARVARAVEAHR